MKTKYAAIFPNALTAPLFIALVSACNISSEISISEPARGTMLGQEQDTVARIDAPADTIYINGEERTGGSPFLVNLPQVDGLGFAVAEIPGDPLVAVRSWHQGNFLAKDEFHTDTMVVTLGSGALNNDPTSVATLVEDLLHNANLGEFIENPLKGKVKVGFLSVSVKVDVGAITTESVTINLGFDGPNLAFNATLNDVRANFKAKAGVSVNGTAIYDSIHLRGRLLVSKDGVTLVNPTVDIPNPRVEVSPSIANEIATEIGKRFRAAIPETVIQAARDAAQTVFLRLITDLKPRLAVEFQNPLNQDTKLETIEVADQHLVLRFSTRIRATNPIIAKENHGVLQRKPPTSSPRTNLATTIGPRLINQYAFAAWDAGNLSQLEFTKEQLHELGLPELSFPYSQLNKVTITLLLPPILAWDDEGPRFDVGGIAMDIDVANSADMKAWTAARAPVTLVQHADDELRLQPDSTRPARIFDVEFSHLNELADHDVVIQLMHAAVPGVIARVFGELPTVVIPHFQLEHLNGRPSHTVDAKIRKLETGPDGWVIDISLEDDGL